MALLKTQINPHATSFQENAEAGNGALATNRSHQTGRTKKI